MSVNINWFVLKKLGYSMLNVHAQAWAHGDWHQFKEPFEWESMYDANKYSSSAYSMIWEYSYRVNSLKQLKAVKSI